MNLVISDLEKASSVSELKTPATGLVFFDLEEMVKNDHRYGVCAPKRVYQAINILKQDEVQLSVPLVSHNDETATLSGTAIFSKDKMIGSLTQNETTYMLMLQNYLKKAYIPLEKYNMTFEILKSDTKVKLLPDSKLSVLLELDAVLVQNKTYDYDYDLQVLSNELSDAVKQSCNQLIEKAKKWNTDIFGFGQAVENEELLSHDFASLPIQIQCKVNMKLGEMHQ